MWKAVEGFPHYQVSEAGQVRSIDRVNSYGRKVRGRILKPYLDTSGYLRVNVSYGVATKKAYIHHMVAEAFIGKRPRGQDVCHKNGNRSDNKARNLRYDTRSGNERDKVGHGRSNRGERSSASRLTEEIVRDIRKRNAKGVARKVLAAEYGVTRQTVDSVVTRRNWAWLR